MRRDEAEVLAQDWGAGTPAALALYRALGLEVVEPGCGRMTGIIPTR